MSHNRIQRVDLRWTPQGKRMKDKPKATWRRTVEKEIKAIGLTLGEAGMTAQDRIDWRPHTRCHAQSKKKRRKRKF